MTYCGTPWLVFYKKNPHAILRLFCLHYAGGSASTFRSWVDYLPATVELVAVQLPGREGRFVESFVTQFDDLIDTLVEVINPYLDKPYVVFGHSLGTLNSFEWIRELKRRCLKQPRLFIASGRRAPQFPNKYPPISALPEREFIQKLLNKYADNLEFVLEKKELREIFIPQLRADFKLVESYKYKEGIQIDCPIFAFTGENESEFGKKELLGWADHTSNQFRATCFPGDHFFIRQSEAQVLQAITHELSTLIKSS